MLMRMMRWARGLTLTSCTFMFSLGAVAQPLSPTSIGLGAQETELARWAVTQGGLLVVVLLLVWSYRRDFARAHEEERGRADMAMQMMEKATAALVTHSDAMRLHTDSVQRLTDAVKACQLVQQALRIRLEDDQG